MSEIVNVALDAMGGDNAPGEVVKGAVEAVNDKENIRVYLTGPKARIDEELAQYTGFRSPMVVLDNLFPASLVHSVVMNNRQAGALAADALYALMESVALRVLLGVEADARAAKRRFSAMIAALLA